MKFGTIPPEPAAIDDSGELCPAFRVKSDRVLDGLERLGWRPIYRETVRSDARAIWLYGFGRDYDDDRGIVTNASDSSRTWHSERFCLAADIVDERYGDNAPAQFWLDLYTLAMLQGLTSGQDWHRTGHQNPDPAKRDNPHVQWWIPGMKVSPSAHALELFEAGGKGAVWVELQAA